MSNTINKKVSCFRKLCNLAAMEGYNKNAVSLRVWKDKAVKEIDKRAEIYLTDEEIDAMYELKLTGDNEVVRDIFLLGYFSCQRYSDYCKLREENFITYNKSGLITLTQKKTKKKVEVPIFDDRVYGRSFRPPTGSTTAKWCARAERRRSSWKRGPRTVSSCVPRRSSAGSRNAPVCWF